MLKKRKIIALTLITVMTVCMSTYSLTFAESVSDKKDKIDNIEEQQSELSDSLSDLASKAKTQQGEIDSVQAKVDSKQDELDKTQASIDKTEKKIKERKEGLDNRLRAMYKNGSIGYLDILLGSNSISEFISNIEMVQKIYKNDQTTLTTLKKQQTELETSKAKLKAEKIELDSQKAELVEKQSALKNTQASIQAQYDALDRELDKLASEIAQLEAAQNVPSHYGGGQFQWPCNSTLITSWFGNRPASDTNGIGSTNHGGIDIGASSGSPIYACASGTVTLASWYGGYGNCVMISHGSGLTTLYGHMSSIGVSSGQKVNKGDVIGAVGSTGNSTGPHLHLSVFVNGTPVDPMNYL